MALSVSPLPRWYYFCLRKLYLCLPEPSSLITVMTRWTCCHSLSRGPHLIWNVSDRDWQRELENYLRRSERLSWTVGDVSSVSWRDSVPQRCANWDPDTPQVWRGLCCVVMRFLWWETARHWDLTATRAWSWCWPGRCRAEDGWSCMMAGGRAAGIQSWGLRMAWDLLHRDQIRNIFNWIIK